MSHNNTILCCQERPSWVLKIVLAAALHLPGILFQNICGHLVWHLTALGTRYSSWRHFCSHRCHMQRIRDFSDSELYKFTFYITFTLHTNRQAEGSAQSVYRSMVASATASGAHPAAGAPRNTTQLKNTQSAVRNQSRFSKLATLCELQAVQQYCSRWSILHLAGSIS